MKQLISLIIFRSFKDLMEVFALLLDHVDIDEHPQNRGIINFFHSSATRQAEETVLEGFRLGIVRCLVTTIAFGLGIDIPDVRRVIHFGPPNSCMDYWQEV
jgi:superfamily II DNA helicase RecQ